MDARGYCRDRLESSGTVPPSHHGHDLDRWPLCDTLMLRALPDAVPSARARLRQLLSGWSLTELSQDAGVVVSELVTNSVAASAERRSLPAPVLVWLGSDSHCLLLSVADASPLPPVRLNLRPDAEGGRGLALVEALSSRWGWYPASVAGLWKVVWAEWRLPDRVRSHDVSGLTDAELERTRRDLRASLALARPGSTACAPMLAHLSAVESELAGLSLERVTSRPGAAVIREMVTD